MAWDRYLESEAVLLIGIGSDMRMMDLLTEYPAELHGRPTREMTIAPLTPAEVAEFAGVSATEAFDRYLVVGGFPQLVDSWPGHASRGQPISRRRAAWANESTLSSALKILVAKGVVSEDLPTPFLPAVRCARAGACRVHRLDQVAGERWVWSRRRRSSRKPAP